MALNYKTAADILSRYDLPDFNDPAKVASYVADFGLDDLLQRLDEDMKAAAVDSHLHGVDPEDDIPFAPEWDDLCRLHFLALSRRALNVMEFGSGFSTAVLASAMAILRDEFGDWATENLRVAEPFTVYSIEEDQRFADITKRRIGRGLRPFAKIFTSSISMAEHDLRPCTLYDNLPNVSPDLIYLDGPSQFATNEIKRGFSFADPCRMPMAADLLAYEFFYEPGTFVLVDGRTANTEFLRAYFKRNWVHSHDPAADIHTLELVEAPLGKFNARKMAFCLRGET